MGATAATITAAATTAAAAGGSATMSGISSKKTREYNKWALQKQREWQLQDTADQRAYTEELYNKYNSPAAQRRLYKEGGYSALAAVDGDTTIQPASQQATTSAAADSMSANAAANQMTASGFANASATIQNSVMQYAQLQQMQEQTRGMRIENDFNEEQTANQSSIWNTEVSKDDFPQLAGYDDDFFDRFSEKLGHQVTLRDMYSAALAKQAVHQANAIAGHDHHWRGGVEYEAANGHYRGENDFNSYYGNDNAMQTLLDTFYAERSQAIENADSTALDNEHKRYQRDNDVWSSEAKESKAQADMASIQADFETFKKENGGWIATLNKMVAEGTMSQTDAEWRVVEKWLNAISTAGGAISDIIGSVNPSGLLKALAKPKSTPRNNYKVQTEHYNSEGIMTKTTIRSHKYE